MKRYIGNTGVYERLPEPDTFIVSQPLQESGAVSEILRKPSSQSGNLGGLEGFLGGLGAKPGGGLGNILSGLSGNSGGGLGNILSGLGGSSSGGLGSLLSGLGGKSGGGLGSILGGLGGGQGGILSGLGGGLSGILGGLGGKPGEGGGGILGGLLSRITRPNLELEDIILVAVFYLLYRESKDIEFLLIAGAMLFL
ncbi:MAG: hypothetical protein CVU91_10245 [Firmicutes bacterium HGW-Firmicutes-16]|nr:MAG: hypothetical protein CVU91_10245 [Firmicutes bacterium HGW-Firmicutes-16]